jgi:ankyrin repeat protein
MKQIVFSWAFVLIGIFSSHTFSAQKSRAQSDAIPIAHQEPCFKKSLYADIRAGDYEAIQKLLAENRAVQTWVQQDNQALFNAIIDQQPRIAKLLIDHGTHLDQKSSHGTSMPLHIICNFCIDPSAKSILFREFMAKLFLVKQADLEVKDDCGNTPLIKAVETSCLQKNRNYTVIRFLLAAGADVNAKNERGSTAIDEAAALADAQLIQLLVAAGADATAAKSRYKLFCAIEDIKFDETIFNKTAETQARYEQEKKHLLDELSRFEQSIDDQEFESEYEVIMADGQTGPEEQELQEFTLS